MTSPQTLADIERLYAARGGLHYGEGVTQTRTRSAKRGTG